MKLCEAAKNKEEKLNRIPNNRIGDVVDLFSHKVIEPYLVKKEGLIDKHINIIGNWENSPVGMSDSINIILKINGEDKKEEREMFNNYLDKVPDDIIVPFESEKYSEEKAKNSGEVTSVLFKWDVENDKNVQINITFSIDKKEMDFKTNLINLPNDKRNLISGWVRVAMNELPEEQTKAILKKAGLEDVELEDGAVFEFGLSHKGLTIRKVLYKQYKSGEKEILKKVLWTSANWNDFKKIFPFDISRPFYLLARDMNKYIKNKKSRERIYKYVESELDIQDKEVETPEGRKKIKSRDRLKKEFNITESFAGWINEN